jgi:hypothetical protein
VQAHFRHYYPLTQTELDNLWDTGLIVLDTNVLFNLYRFSLGTRTELLDTLEEYAERLWLPHRVGLEYHRGRIDLLLQLRSPYQELKGLLAEFDKGAETLLGQYSNNRHPVLSKESTLPEIRKLTAGLSSFLNDLEADHPDLPAGRAPGSIDPILDRLTSIFEGRVGDPFTDDEHDEIYREGALRYSAKIPPGFMDQNKKEGNEIYGDLVIWKEVLRKAETATTPIIFVTGDQKDDWWLRKSNKTIGPRPELVREIWERAHVPFHMYRPVQFLKYAQQRQGGRSTITDRAISEVESLATHWPDSLSATYSEILDEIVRIDLESANVERELQRHIRGSAHARNLDRSHSDLPQLIAVTDDQITSALSEMEFISSSPHYTEETRAEILRVLEDRINRWREQRRIMEQQMLEGDNERWLPVSGPIAGSYFKTLADYQTRRKELADQADSIREATRRAGGFLQ